MTGRERMLAALKGLDVDRPPIWLREGINIIKDDKVSSFLTSWKEQDIYRSLISDIKESISVLGKAKLGQGNRFLMIPDINIKRTTKEYENERIINGKIKTSKGNLTFTKKQVRGQNTTWDIEHPAKELKDLVSIIEMPFIVDKAAIKKAAEQHRVLDNQIGNYGAVQVFLSSPIVCISAAAKFEDFFIWSITERKFFEEMLEEITRRSIRVLEEFIKHAKGDLIFTLGGSEQCTPPMMSPTDFNTLVTQWDGKIVEYLKKNNAIVTCHCHGRTRDALPAMIKMGYDATDPVEPPPAGDITWQEAKKIANEKITLMGNIEWDELECADTSHIRQRVREILSTGKNRTIIGTSAGPISEISHKLADNYRALVDEALKISQ